MELLQPELLFVIGKFPALSDRIHALYKNDSDFKTLCEDYFFCIDTLHKYRNEFRKKQSAIKEYEVVRKDLEKELQDFLLAASGVVTCN